MQQHKLQSPSSQGARSSSTRQQQPSQKHQQQDQQEIGLSKKQNPANEMFGGAAADEANGIQNGQQQPTNNTFLSNNNTLSGEILSTNSKKSINPAVVKALEELKAWFHGKMDRFKASKILKNDGDFLIRLGKSMDDLSYKPVLSVKWHERHYHFLIKELNSLFWIESFQFGSIASLIRYYLHTKKPVTEFSGVIIKTPMLSKKFNPLPTTPTSMASTQQSTAVSKNLKMKQRMMMKGKSPMDGFLEATRSISYAILGEHAPPYVIDHTWARSHANFQDFALPFLRTYYPLWFVSKKFYSQIS